MLPFVISLRTVTNKRTIYTPVMQIKFGVKRRKGGSEALERRGQGMVKQGIRAGVSPFDSILAGAKLLF